MTGEKQGNNQWLFFPLSLDKHLAPYRGQWHIQKRSLNCTGCERLLLLSFLLLLWQNSHWSPLLNEQVFIRLLVSMVNLIDRNRPDQGETGSNSCVGAYSMCVSNKKTVEEGELLCSCVNFLTVIFLHSKIIAVIVHSMWWECGLQTAAQGLFATLVILWTAQGRSIDWCW